MKIGSLFDGSGGFQLAGYQNGLTPVWASEVEPYPIRVTKERFPGMKHLGSVTEINGGEIEPVDVITFGSPCQDLSVAGKQKGIHDGERSSLFFEAVRIIKEMRENDRDNGRTDQHIRPRFAVWENVHGAYSSSGGRDFQTVLQALCEIADPGVSIPFPENGKWNRAGCIVGNGYSIAWRTYDAQYWGVPQRRKRIYLIADFASERAGEILFERESVPGYLEPGEKTGQGTAGDAERSAGGSDPIGWDPYNGQLTGDVSSTIGTNCGMPNGRNGVIEKTAAFMGGQGAKARGIAYCDDGTTPTLKASNSGSNQAPDVVYAIEGDGNVRAHIGENISPCMKTIHQNCVSYATTKKWIVRRLTPLECCRLQGFPDGWGDVSVIKELSDEEYAFWLSVRNTHAAINGKKQANYTKEQMIRWLNSLHTDGAEYKMWGNGIALPCASDVMRRIAKEMRR